VLVALWKPWGVLSRFTPDGSRHRPLSVLGLPSGVHAIGRLDADSEGLLLLGDESALVRELLAPGRHPKTYWAQVEGVPDARALARLASGVLVQGRRTRPCSARRLAEPPALPPREPPIRRRLRVPDCWIELVLREGRNRQVRRMTAAVGHPTLRLVRVAIGGLRLADLGLAPGGWRLLAARERARLGLRELHPRARAC
jgi:23S rRNA pseudouridine2457 synthase